MSASPPTSDAPCGTSLPAGLARILDQVRRRHLLVRLAEFPVLLLASLATAWMLQAAADRVFDLSWNVRSTLLAIDFIGVLWLLLRFVVRPWRQRLDREDAALFIERGMPEFRTALISAVELAASTADTLPQSRPLVTQLIREVTEHVGRANVVARVIRLDRLKRLLARMSAPVVAALLLLGCGQPVAGLLLRRILLSDEALPTRTHVISVTCDVLVDEGGEAVLTAMAAGEVPPAGRLVVTHLGRPLEVIPVVPSAADVAEFSQPVKNVREGFTYHFELNDSIGPEHQVCVRFPPSAKTLSFVEVPPAYTKLPEIELSPTSLKLLEGSTLRIEGTATKNLRGGQVRIQGQETAVDLTVDDGNAKQFCVAIPVPGSGWKSLTVHLESTDGIGSVGDPVYPIELRRDRPPTVTITLPKDDTITVIANDSVPIGFEVNDDFELTSVVMLYRVFRQLPDGNLETTGEGKVPLAVPPGGRAWKHRFTWNLARLVPAITTGYNIIVWIEATDNNDITRATGRSAERTIRVISEQEKRLELLELLGRKAAEIEQLYEQQRAINSRTEGTAP